MSSNNDKHNSISWTLGSMAAALIMGVLVHFLSPQKSATDLEYLSAIIWILSIGITFLTTIVIIVIKNFHAGYDDRRNHTDEIIKKIDILTNNTTDKTNGLAHKIDTESNFIIRAVANADKVVNLGNIISGHKRLIPLMESSIRVCDVAYRPDGIKPEQYKNGFDIWAKAIRERASSGDFGTYDLVISDATKTYYEKLIRDGVNPSEDIKNKFHIRTVGAKALIPYPSFLLFYGENGVNTLVLGWPFKGVGTIGDLFLIENRGLVDYFDKICSATLDESVSQLYVQFHTESASQPEKQL